MNERLHRYMDGDLRRVDLTPEELHELAHYERLFGRFKVMAMSTNAPDMTPGLLERIAEMGPVPSRSWAILSKAGAWLWAPRSIRLRPAYAILALALLLLFVTLERRNAVDPDSVTHQVFVQFRLEAPGAKNVRLAGTFSGWKPVYALQEFTPGHWAIIIPLDSGVHSYSFVIDSGQWLPDPAAPAVADGFGGVNSRLSILLPTEI